MARPESGFRSRSARHPAIVIGNGIFTALLLLCVVGGLGAWYAQHQFRAPGPLKEERTVFIPRGSSVRDMAETLARQGVITDETMFVLGQKLARKDANMQAGEYIFKPGQSVESVIDTIASGDVVKHQVTIPEGLTSQQVVERLMAIDLLRGSPAVPPEGTLLPETYRYDRGGSRDDILKDMAAAQQRLLKQLWAGRDPSLPVKTPREMVVLASIVEKETGQADERPRVAAVFVNRLNKKMKLQSDPTIIYGIVGGKGSLGRAITRSDIATPTPYNTYAIDGLPPGPIANPGRDALAAVANPPKTDDLFFVADGTGGHSFAPSLAEHNRNVARWRAIEADAKAKAGLPAASDASAAPAAN